MGPKRLSTGTSASPWQLCDTCECTILSKDLSLHSEHCPPDRTAPPHIFVADGVLYARADVKTNEDVRGVASHDVDDMVFLSQSVVQICRLSIGGKAIVQREDGMEFVRTVWPTTEKSLGSVLFSKNALDIMGIATDSHIQIKEYESQLTEEAVEISVVNLNAPKSMELTPELQNRLHKSHLERIVAVGNTLGVLFYGKILKFKIYMIVKDIATSFNELSLRTGKNFYVITEKTTFNLYVNERNYKRVIKKKSDPFKKIGGLCSETAELRDLITATSPPGFNKTKAVLLYGSPGTGKTLLCNALAATLPFTAVHINASLLYGKLQGNAEENIRSLFSEAKTMQPSLIVLDEIDTLCPARSSGKLSDVERRVCNTVLVELDELDGDVFVLATTNKLDGVDGGLRRCGRLEREMEIPVPNPKARLDILEKLLSESMDNIEGDFLQEIAYNTHGFVGADLVALCSRAALHASSKGCLKITFEDFTFALTKVRPSAMREVQVEVPNVKWADIGGQSRLKLTLRQSVEWPLKHSASFKRLGITPPRGVLLYGPPGCSKTMIAKALATESGLNFLSIKGPELFSKWVGESERAVREVFRKARQVAPSIIFFDEIDALGGERTSGSGGGSNVQERVLAQMLTELDGVTDLGDVTILAATNRPDRIDKALLRPGRLDRIVYVPLPDAQTRAEIFKIKFKKMPVNYNEVSITTLVNCTEGYSGAEVNAVCHEAAMAALEDNIEASIIDVCHFQKALQIVTPRTPESLLKIYEEYSSNK